LKKSHKSRFRSEYPADFMFDYKDPVTLHRFLSDGGKIVPGRISKLSFQQQKAVAREIKKARNIGLLPNGMEAFDTCGRPENISPKPFEI
jgi:small subunit ribosomal protein S18